jgi:hypothetical protein
MKIRLVGADFFHADGRTNRQDEADSRFSQYFEILFQRVLPVIRHTYLFSLKLVDYEHLDTQNGFYSVIYFR